MFGSLLLKHTPRMPDCKTWMAMSEQERHEWRIKFAMAPAMAARDFGRMQVIAIGVMSVGALIAVAIFSIL